MVLGLPFLPQETIWGIVCSESPIWPWTIAPQMGNWDSVRECNAKDNKALGCRGNTVVDNDNIYIIVWCTFYPHLYTNIFNTYIAQALAVASEQCVTITETSLKNITLVNFLIILILIIVVAANVNEGNFFTMLTMMKIYHSSSLLAFFCILATFRQKRRKRNLIRKNAANFWLLKETNSRIRIKVGLMPLAGFVGKQ